MNSKTKTILSLIIFLIFLAGAYFLYTGLMNKNQPGTDNIRPPETVRQDGDIQPDENNDSDTATDSEDEAGQEKKLKALDFTVYDREGKGVNLSDFYGKPIIINFWATWCPYCVEEMPYFEEKYREYGEKVNFLMIDAVDGNTETKEKGEKFIEEGGFTFPVYFDTDGNAVYTYQAYSLPTSVFIDADGYIIAYQPGMLTPDMLQMGIDLILQADPEEEE
ncbi:MAG TPA: TlpA family protein disulfide reductase [Ruminiclostridium sp.]|jgi:thiol-disulfide isomerase/thioredoxin|nr:TlpA family protein disulfide reductase [Clostridiaceae bacterium]HAA25706.1 TlpA family protein disulfide reductase [Ruminiclostridium sp.]